ncbi:hypothetical protein FOL47_003275 [Perkinsus chesapeaki]|uniref:FLYWCH-type domain-containing protein n=1 Tax=Perkinsus chesapeaki TaxID=330153 RepID=A0A7J6N2X2_PERCH|nr:hypothetical protein FOL47_003275 [Perkinsus chesapeaki]
MAKTATFRTSQRGKVVCIVDDNVYHMQRVYKDRVYWACKSRGKGCKARLVTTGDRVVKQTHEHCCGLSARGVSRASLSVSMPYNTPVEETSNLAAVMAAPEAPEGPTPLDFGNQQLICDATTLLSGYSVEPEGQVTVQLGEGLRGPPPVPAAPLDPLLC